jgi:hypothetical protein
MDDMQAAASKRKKLCGTDFISPSEFSHMQMTCLGKICFIVGGRWIWSLLE